MFCEHSCFSCYDLTICLVSLLLLSSPLLTFDLSDLETSVDSRCTTDSADSAFIARRYWFPASSFLPFLFSNHPLPSSPTQEVRLERRLQEEETILFFLAFLSQLLMFCCPSLSSQLFILMCLSICLLPPPSVLITLPYLPEYLRLSGCVYACLLYYTGLYDSASFA